MDDQQVDADEQVELRLQGVVQAAARSRVNSQSAPTAWTVMRRRIAMCLNALVRCVFPTPTRARISTLRLASRNRGVVKLDSNARS